MPGLDTIQQEGPPFVLENVGAKARHTSHSSKRLPKRAGAYSASEKSSLSVGSPGDIIFSPAWIKNEALNLLGRIHQNAPQKHECDLGRALLAGYGLAGIIVKQVVLLANTAPRFYDIALNVSDIVFFNTPHKSSEQSAWEEILLEMLRSADVRSAGQLTRVVSKSACFFAKVSKGFLRHASRYSLNNSVCDNDVEQRLDKSVYRHELLRELPWRGGPSVNLWPYTADELHRLESLRNCFAPFYLLSIRYRSTPGVRDGVSQKQINQVYFETLQILSPSRWVLSETQILHEPEESMTLRKIYKGILSRSRMRKMCGCCVQITGPSGCGKWVLAKLVVQNLCYESAALVVALPPKSQKSFKSPYSIYTSFLHQILSRRSHLFPSVYNLLSEVIRDDHWTENMLKSILASILSQAQDVTFLFAIHDFPSWPTEVQAWCLDMAKRSQYSSKSSCVWITTSEKARIDFGSLQVHHFDLTKKLGQYKKRFVQAKTDILLEKYYDSTSAKDDLSRDVRRKIIRSGTSLHGSFDSLNRYLEYMFQTFTLSSAEAIERNIRGAPSTELELMQRHTADLNQRPLVVVEWVISALSWILLSVRPLRLQELAVATALRRGVADLSSIRTSMCLDIEADLRRLLPGFLVIENEHVCIVDRCTIGTLTATDAKLPLQLLTNGELTTSCLEYLTAVLSDNRPGAWDRGLGQMLVPPIVQVP
ncbi:hypothetical protein K491DRAFT_716020 [Lophiostoma macrostomum CBS 122681]|uniref:Nephrocystin 3-like N-terminal domain-containing protein n=1 Tax=Lophiostoma macrostomum CBS 122681 TaxID=1314788 RepID=A0A6A6T8V2_9PLEO|nr:hypothetical protein K491DRAFT_716020 [Lophiostoma macrostomum CBS 122681]